MGTAATIAPPRTANQRMLAPDMNSIPARIPAEHERGPQVGLLHHQDPGGDHQDAGAEDRPDRSELVLAVGQVVGQDDDHQDLGELAELELEGPERDPARGPADAIADHEGHAKERRGSRSRGATRTCAATCSRTRWPQRRPRRRRRPTPGPARTWSRPRRRGHRRRSCCYRRGPVRSPRAARRTRSSASRRHATRHRPIGPPNPGPLRLGLQDAHQLPP